MKFGKVLQSTVEHFPEKPFFSYKKLKKVLKSIASSALTGATEEAIESESGTDSQDGDDVYCDHTDFIKPLNQELQALNSHFISEEEEMVIRLQALESALESAKLDERYKQCCSLVRFHGDVISLLHWVRMNYAAIAKILKKHDKLLTGHRIRQSFLRSVSRQPFYSTELLEKLAKRSETLIVELNPATEVAEFKGNDNSGGFDAAEDIAKGDELTRLRQTLHAIRTWRDLGDNAHTPSTVLPYSKPIPDYMKIQNEQDDVSTMAAQKKRPCPSSEDKEDDSEIASPSGKVAKNSE